MQQVYFITGSASGIGRHLAHVLQAQGACIYAADLNFAALKQAALELSWPEERVQLAQLNVTKFEEWQRAMDHAVRLFGRVDVTMNIAGLLLASWAECTPLAEIDAQVDVNVKGVIYGTRVSAEVMVRQGHGHIINIASIAGLVPVPGMAVYCATKYAVRGYSLAAALELRPKGVYVTAVCPSTVETPMLDRQVENDAAEMFFSGHSILTLQDIEEAVIHRALRHKPYEVHVPRVKIWIIRWVDVFPFLAPIIAPLYRRSGRKRQEERRRRRA